MRAKVEIEDSDYGRKNIVVTEIPYTIAGNKTKLLENLVSLSKDKVFDEIYDVRDESSKEGIRIVIEVKKDRNIGNLLNGLYQKTGLEDTYGVNMLAVKDKQPITFTLKGLIEEFVLFQEELYTKEYSHLLSKAKDRLEIVNGLIRATYVIDLIIEILRGSDSIKQAKDCLIHGITDNIRFKTAKSEKQAGALDFTERQADAILAMPLGRLIGLEILKLRQENETLLSNIAEYEEILSDIDKLHEVIKIRLKKYKKEFGCARRTELTNIGATKYVEEIKEESLYILIDRFGYCKSVDDASYSRIAPETLAEYSHIVPTKNTDKLCCFSSNGFMYQIKASQIPKGKSKDKGVLVQSLCKIEKEDILTYISFEDLFESQLFFATKKGLVKLVSGVEFETNRTMISATKLDEDDELICVKPLTVEDVISDDRKVILLTKGRLALGYPLNQVNEFKKTSRGLKGIHLTGDDTLVFADIVSFDAAEIVYNNKKYNPQKIRTRKRGDKAQKIGK